MRIAAIAAIVLSSMAGADVKYYDDSNTAVAFGDQGSTFHTTASPKRGCQLEHYFVESWLGGELEVKTIRLSFRVDNKTTWNAELDLAARGKYLYGFLPGSEPVFITELRRGRMMRVKAPQRDGSTFYEGYSLMGFSSAVSQVKRGCVPHDSYFNRPSSSNGHEIYL